MPYWQQDIDATQFSVLTTIFFAKNALPCANLRGKITFLWSYIVLIFSPRYITHVQTHGLPVSSLFCLAHNDGWFPSYSACAFRNPKLQLVSEEVVSFHSSPHQNCAMFSSTCCSELLVQSKIALSLIILFSFEPVLPMHLIYLQYDPAVGQRPFQWQPVPWKAGGPSH